MANTGAVGASWRYVASDVRFTVRELHITILGAVRLMPRLKRIKYERLYLPNKGMAESYPNLAGTFARPIRWDLVEQQYDEMVKSSVAIKRGTASTEAILKRYNSYNVTPPTYNALAEVGKAEKTIFLCDYLPSLEIQREVHEGLNVVENWNATNDFICYGRPRRVSDEQPRAARGSHLSLQLLQNCLMLIDTILVERAIERNGLSERLNADDRSARINWHFLLYLRRDQAIGASSVQFDGADLSSVPHPVSARQCPLRVSN